MSYSVSMSGHTDSKDSEHEVLKKIAAVVVEIPETEMGYAVASTQHHGQVNLRTFGEEHK